MVSPVAQRGGSQSYGAPTDSREAQKDQITRIKWGSGKAKSRAPEGPRKVVYGHDRLYSSCSFGQLMIGTSPYLCCRFDPKGPKGTRKGTLASVIRPNWLLVDNYSILWKIQKNRPKGSQALNCSLCFLVPTSP
jgi:hypothetical protein